MRYRIHIISLAIALILCGCSGSSGDKKQTTINISGAFALYPLTVKWAEAYMQEHPEVRINISAGGAGKGMTDALSDMVDLGMFSREVSKEEQQKGAWKVAVARDAVLPTINISNPYLEKLLKKGVTKEQLQEIFLNKTITCWEEIFGDKDEMLINLYTRSDACGAAAMWAAYLGAAQEDLAGTGVFGDPGVADAVKRDMYGLGFNNLVYVFDVKTKKKYEGIEVLPLDLNGNRIIDKEEDFYSDIDAIAAAVKNGIYPSPPARDLYFISHQKPQKKHVLDFLTWVLSDGQQYVETAGYIAIPGKQLKEELQKIQ